MSHPNATINGCSLEDCHTNLFALTDLAGIKWRKYIGESSFSTEPLDDHVLASFTRCIKSDVLCVWRRGQKNNEPRDQLPSKKELWIFWYGDEPTTLSHLVSPDLQVDHSVEGSWEENGLSYECRTLLFKALHNLIERCLLQQNFIRIGKWFVQPFDQRHTHDKGAHLSIQFSFFLHGESTVCASIDVRQHPPLWRLQAYHLSVSTQAGQAGLPVILAPYGLAGTLTGQAYKDTDITSQRILAEWQEFYIVADHDSSHFFSGDEAKCAKVVEVTVGGARMRYPAAYVLVTGDVQQEILRHHGGSIPNSLPSFGPAPGPSSPPPSPKMEVGEPAIKLMPRAAYVDNTYTPALNIEGGKAVSGRITDKMWLDSSITSGAQHNSRHQQAQANEGSSQSDIECVAAWDYADPIDPVHKSSCGCSRHRAHKRNSGSQSKGSGPSPNSKHGGVKTEKSEKGDKLDVKRGRSSIPFHRRSNLGQNFLQHDVDYLMQSMPAKSVGTFKPLLPTPAQGSGGGVGAPPVRGSGNGNNQAAASGNSATPNTISSTTPGSSGGSSSSSATAGEPSSTGAPSGGGSNTPAPAPSSANASFEGTINALGTGVADSPHSAAPSPLMASQIQPSTMSHNGDPTMPTLSPHPPSKHDKDSATTTTTTTTTPTTTSCNTNGGTGNNAAVVPAGGAANSHQTPPSGTNSVPSITNPAHGPNKPGDPGGAVDGFQVNGISPAPGQQVLTNGPVETFTESVKSGQEPTQNAGTKSDVVKMPYRTNTSQVEVVIKTEPMKSWLDTQQNKYMESHGIKRPSLPTKHYDDDDGEIVTSSLYDFDSLTAWLEHPVKRLKFEEDGSVSASSQGGNNRGGNRNDNNHTSPANHPSHDPYEFSDDNSDSVHHNFRKDEMFARSFDDARKVEENGFPFKEEPNPDSPPDGAPATTGFSLGLRDQELIPKMEDLNNLFDTSDSESNDGGVGDQFMMPSPPQTRDEKPTLKSSLLVRDPPAHTHSELSKMFPTPPSTENRDNALSPVDGHDGQTDLSTTHDAIIPQQKVEFLHLTGEDSVKDFSFVYRPPLAVEFVSSSKYSPIKLPSSQLKSLPLVPNYRPSWQHQTHFQMQPIIEKPSQAQPSHYTNVPSVDNSSQRTSTTTGTDRGANTSIETSPATFGGPHSAQGRTPRTPMSYELQSPASNASSAYPHHNPNSVGNPTTNSSLAEAHSLVVNIMLSDSQLNIFKDHNYDSCTICVCNTNIKGSDVGLYIIDRTGEGQYPCICGFSAVMNRKCGVYSGLFYEDEVDISGIRDDHLERRKPSLLALANKDDPNKPIDKSVGEVVPQNIMQLLTSQFSSIYPSATIVYNCSKSHPSLEGHVHDHINTLEVQDGCEATYMALEVGRQAMENCPSNKLDDPALKRSCIHKWSYLQATAKFPANSQDVVRLLKGLQPILQDAIQKKRTVRLWDHVYTITGPLSWKDFHLLAGRGSDESSEPQPVPTLLVGHDKDLMKFSPHAVRYWDKLMVEPFGKQVDVAYIVVAPENDFILGHVKQFFGEICRMYEQCRLGKHRTLSTKLRDSVLRVGKAKAKSLSEEPVDDWFKLLGNSPVAAKLRLYAQVCRHDLAPFICRAMEEQAALRSIFTDLSSSSLNKQTNVTSGPGSNLSNPRSYNSEPSPAPPQTPDSGSVREGGTATGTDRGTTSGGEEKENESDQLADGQCHGQERKKYSGLLDNGEDELPEPPSVVVYLIDPFTYSQEWGVDINRLAMLGLLRCYQEMIGAIQSNLNINIQLQIVPMQTILDYHDSQNTQHLKNLSLAVYTQCRKLISHTVAGKSMTGFGPAAAALDILAKKDPNSINALQLYNPPYIIAPVHESKIAIHDTGKIEKSGVLLCAYCLSEDQRWLLGVCTDNRGELLETCTINVEIPNRNRRKKASARRIGLAKLWDFVMSMVSLTMRPWRIVIGRFGRIGHGELKGWAGILSSKHLGLCNKQLQDLCSNQCGVLRMADTPIILSACLISMETHSTLHVMPDSVKIEEEKLSSRIQMDTPRDASCTHILVVPTSATAQANQPMTGPGEDLDTGLADPGDPLEKEDDLIDMMNMMGNGMGDMGDMGDLMEGDMLGDLFRGFMTSDDPIDQHNSGGQQDHLGGDIGPFGRKSGEMGSVSDPQDETPNLLQQPLAIGFYTSTAKTGPLPKWFWSACPHREHICPTCLKAALHVNVRPQDTNWPKSNHPLDSTYTCDVLRYVLETYNTLSWLNIDPSTNDRRSCLPIHFVVLMQLYHALDTFV